MNLWRRYRLTAVITLVTMIMTALVVTTSAPGVSPVAAAVSDCNGGSGAGEFALGDGSAGDPYHVTSSAQLVAMGTSDCLDEHYLQQADIALAGAWTPIGTSGTPFTGSYDGGGHAITGLAVTGVSYLGLFGAASNVTLQRLALSGTVSASSTRAGLLVGSAASAVISDVSVSGRVVAAGVNHTHGAGGLVGWGDASVQIVGATNSAEVVGNVAGGFIGFMAGHATISASTNHGRILGGNDGGGFVGRQQSGNLIADSLTNHGHVSASSTNAGGLAGRIEAAVVATNSMNLGDADGGFNVGGFVGNVYHGATVHASSNQGRVTGSSPSSNVGGLLGLVNQHVAITSSINDGDVAGGNAAGGLVALTGGAASLDTGTNRGAVTASAAGSVAGGLIAFSNGSATIVNGTNESDVQGADRAGGLLGYVNVDVSVSASSNRGTIRATGSFSSAGGLVAFANRDADFTSSTNDGAVHGDSNVGGFVGYLNRNAEVDSGTNGGAVAATASSGQAAGFLGLATGNVTVSSSTNAGTVSALASAAKAGGLIGLSLGVVSLETVRNEGTIDGDRQAGGLAGFADGDLLVLDGVNAGQVRAHDPSLTQVGGLVGFVSSAVSITRGANEHHVDGANSVGGLVGWMANSGDTASIETSLNRGDVTGTSSDVGGLIGVARSGTTVSASVNHGAVSGTERVGGIASSSGGGLTLLDVYSTGSVTATVRDAGGLAATLAGDLFSTVYASGTVTTPVNAGALVATANNSIVQGAYFDSSLASTANGPGSDTNLTRLSTFADAGWVIESGWIPYSAGANMWGICPRVNGGRPFLLWEYVTDACAVPPTPPSINTTTAYTRPDDVAAVSGLARTASVVFLVAGDSPVDAVLAASAGGVADGVVLPTTSDHAAQATLAEIDRLNPNRIVLVGGEQRLSAALQVSLSARSEAVRVERVAGSDRVATAVAVSQRFHPRGASRVYLVATDAPADAVVAAAQRHPVLFARGATVPEATLDEIERLDPREIVLVGGPTRLPESVVTGLRARFAGATVQRVGGADRYETSALLADPQSSNVLLVNGDLGSMAVFTAPAIAATTGRMLLFGRPGCAPSSVHHLVSTRSVVSIGRLPQHLCD